MTLFLQVCGVLAVLAIPYAVITIADKAMQKRQRAEAEFHERKDKFVHRLNRRAF
jgi:hypothetical protein